MTGAFVNVCLGKPFVPEKADDAKPKQDLVAASEHQMSKQARCANRLLLCCVRLQIARCTH